MFFGSNGSELFSPDAAADLFAPGEVAGIGGGGACSLDGFSSAGFAVEVWASALHAHARIVPMIRNSRLHLQKKPPFPRNDFSCSRFAVRSAGVVLMQSATSRRP